VKRIEDGAAVVIGSRYLPGSEAKRTVPRLIASKAFNWLVRALLGSRITDHQCGFKAFRKEDAGRLLGSIESRRWFWDTEFLVKAQRKGLKIAEVPVRWEEGKDSKFRLIEDTLNMGWNLIVFKLRYG